MATELDAANSVAAYRDAIRRAEAATDEPSRAEWHRVAKRVRERWRRYNGDDDLRELAFGEPVE